MTQRFRVLYGELCGASKRYCCHDFQERKHVLQSDSKSEVIAEAQRQNGWPVTGDERTYYDQAGG